MGSLRRALVDSGRVLRSAKSGDRVEGEHDVTTAEGPPFACLLVVESGEELESGGESHGARLLVGPEADVSAADRVLVQSEVHGEATWEVDGPPRLVRRSRTVIARTADLIRKEGV